MDYCIVNSDGIIENMIVCDGEDTGAKFGAVPSYEGAKIGDKYVRPAETLPDPEPTQLDIIEAQVVYTAMMTNTLVGV